MYLKSNAVISYGVRNHSGRIYSSLIALLVVFCFAQLNACDDNQYQQKRCKKAPKPNVQY